MGVSIYINFSKIFCLFYHNNLRFSNLHIHFSNILTSDYLVYILFYLNNIFHYFFFITKVNASTLIRVSYHVAVMIFLIFEILWECLCHHNIPIFIIKISPNLYSWICRDIFEQRKFLFSFCVCILVNLFSLYCYLIFGSVFLQNKIEKFKSKYLGYTIDMTKL